MMVINVGKTTFIRYLLGRDFPGQRIGTKTTNYSSTSADSLPIPPILSILLLLIIIALVLTLMLLP